MMEKLTVGLLARDEQDEKGARKDYYRRMALEWLGDGAGRESLGQPPGFHSPGTIMIKGKAWRGHSLRRELMAPGLQVLSQIFSLVA